MDRKNKAIVWLVILILLIVVTASIATYAFFTYRTKIHGDFNVDINSKGVDILSFEGGKDAQIVATANNFDRKFGHDLTASTDMKVKLETTNKSASFCYEVFVRLPEDEVFVYSEEGRPELLLTVQRSNDNKKYQNVITNMDITTKTGDVKIPVSAGRKEYLNIISTTKRQVAAQYWKAKLTLVWFDDVSQEINDNKTYNVTLETKRVEC